MKVYVVTSGIYSDYGIDAVFSTIEQARKWTIDNTSYYEHHIEEHEIDDLSPETDEKLYYVQLCYGAWEIHDADDEFGAIPEHLRRFGFYGYHNYIHAKDKEHALRKAKDDYAMLRAREEGL